MSIRICTFCAPAYDICIKNSLHSHAAEFSLGFVSRCPDLKLKSGFMQEFKPVRQRHSQHNAANSEFNHNRIFALSPYTPLKSSARTSQTVNNGRALQRNCPQPEQAEGSPQPHDAAGSRHASVLPCPRDSAGRSLHGHRPPVIPAPTDAPRRHQRRGVARPTRGGTPPPSKTKAPRPPDADQRGGGRGDGDRRGSESTPGQRKPVRARPAHPSRGGGGLPLAAPSQRSCGQRRPGFLPSACGSHSIGPARHAAPSPDAWPRTIAWQGARAGSLQVFAPRIAGSEPADGFRWGVEPEGVDTKE